MVIHEISAWSGKPEDETPLCGADKNDPSVWGQRTVYTATVTCPECQRIRSEWEAEDAGLAWTADGEASQHPRERW